MMETQSSGQKHKSSEGGQSCVEREQKEAVVLSSHQTGACLRLTSGCTPVYTCCQGIYHCGHGATPGSILINGRKLNICLPATIPLAQKCEPVECHCGVGKLGS